MKALTLALNAKVYEHIVPSFKKIDSFLKEWNIGVSDQRELFLTIANILRESRSSPKDSFKFLNKYLATFSVEDVAALSEAKGEAVKAIVEFVKVSDIFQCDLLDLPAVKQLEADGEYTAVYQLLKIFLTQRLDGYTEFQAANSALLETHGINPEDCITKMRLMSLVDLGSDVSKIPYTAIKDALQIDFDEVEFWVVKAMSAKLLNCKLDQMNEVVIVSRSTDRIFGSSQWEHLRTKLATWRANVSNVISTIQLNMAPPDSGAQSVPPSPAIRSN
uniref:PCI domain-containing protein n=1 Tax=Kalanchoe fedtschenkoi TaxID=63787 RepID=A0A7N0UZ77_KALFE